MSTVKENFKKDKESHKIFYGCKTFVENALDRVIRVYSCIFLQDECLVWYSNRQYFIRTRLLNRPVMR